MSSYYQDVTGNLRANATARVEDITQIQRNIQLGEKEYTEDMFGHSFILGSEEDSFKLTATTDYTDQSNTNYDEDNPWISFYDRYLRQSIYTTKSSIESIKLHMYNSSNVSTTIYAEIRDADFQTVIKESSAILNPTDPNTSYDEVVFNFNVDHLPVGVYYFVLRPVDISSTDLAVNGDETPSVTSNDFLVKYDIHGEYHRNLTDYGQTDDDEILKGLEASYNGSDYLAAYYLEDQLIDVGTFSELDVDDPNYDLFFEETYSSGNTYLVKYSDAIVLGEKVQPCDTHIKINGPSTLGDRTDLVVLKKDGTYRVIEGSVYNGEKAYPVDNTGLAIAYITTFKDGNKVSVIEQDDDPGSLTRQRSLLERVRRVEKQSNYQMANNTPSRIKCICEVDPVMFNNGLSQESADTEGSYMMGLTTNEDGSQIVSNNNSVNLIWSIIKNNYKYSYEEKTQTSAYCQVYHVDTAVAYTEIVGQTSSIYATNNKANATPSHSKNGLYIAYLSEKNLTSNNDDREIKKPIKKETIKVTIKQGTSTKHKKTLTTNSKGRATWNLNSLGLKKGKYTIETVVPGNKAIKTKLTVHKEKYEATTGHVTAAVKIKDTVKTTVKESFNDNTITGDDAFDNDGGRINVDTTNGIIELAKVDTSKDDFISNITLKPDTKPKFKYHRTTYKIKSDPKATSKFPVLHLKFDRDTYIKSIRPNVRTFKNMKSFGILLFKNDQVENMKLHKRKTIEKDFKKDVIYTNIFKGTKKVSDATTDDNGVQKLDKFVTFDVNKQIEAGTYSLLIFGKLKKNKEEGYIALRHYETLGNLEKYGLAGVCTGSSNLSTLKMTSNNISNGECWNVKITQRPDKYYTLGTVTSTSKNTSADIQKCHIDANIYIPPGSGCSAELYVSNDGGRQWVDATRSKTVAFPSKNNIFKWKMILKGDGKYSPQLQYKEKKKYAIKFSLNTETSYVPYEDFGRCYETPLINANSLTKVYVSNSNVLNAFREWEWARIFMLDESNKSNIDICFSYDYDNYTTSTQTLKTNWGRKIFFSQIFADLKISDFTSESVDYDNYDGNVEFDEHNYLFRMNSSDVTHDNSGIALAVPTYTGTDYIYGNIAIGENKTAIDSLFTNESKLNTEYKYEGNTDDEPQQYAGEHLISGPYVQAIYNGEGVPDKYNSVQDENKFNYVINGISFLKGAQVDESKSELIINLYPIAPSRTAPTIDELSTLKAAVNDAQKALDDNEDDTQTETLQATLETATDELYKHIFPSESFNVNISLTLDGSIFHEEIKDSDGNVVNHTSNGISRTITEELIPNTFNEVRIDISDNIEAFEANGIGSIGITVNEKADLKKEEGIGISTVTVQAYNRRPYVPHMYTGKWDRLQWQSLKDGAYFYNICTADKKTFLYPSYAEDDISSIGQKFNKDELENANANMWYSKVGTFMNIDNSGGVKSASREKNKISFTTTDNKVHTTTSGGNAVVLQFPADTTGDIFRIDTDIPFSIYDLVDIQYYIYHTMKSTNAPSNDSSLVDDSVIYDNAQHDYKGYIAKGDIKIKFYTQTDIDEETLPAETFSLPSWGRIQQNAQVTDKTVHAWFKTRSNADRIKTIIIERANPTNTKTVNSIDLVLNNIFLHNAETMPALGPQMQMRIYPHEDLSEIQIRKIGAVYRI